MNLKSILSTDFFRSPKRTLGAAFLALVISEGFTKRDIQAIVGPVNGRLFMPHTPYYPGADQLSTHEIFDPWFTNKKKMLFLGSSSTDSIGCDSTWTYPNGNVHGGKRNVHYSCRIDHQLGLLLDRHGYSEWRPFNLARNGSYMIDMLLTYVLASDTKPELVIYGGGRHIFNEIGGWNRFSKENRTGINRFFMADAELKPYWLKLRETFVREGWQPNDIAGTEEQIAPFPAFVPIKNVTLLDLLAIPFRRFHHKKAYVGPPFPPVFNKWHQSDREPGTGEPYRHYDMGFLYGYKIIEIMQKRHGGKLLVYEMPRYNFRNSKVWDEHFSDRHKVVLNKLGLLNRDLVDFELEIEKEVYDNGHHTVIGNVKLAKKIFNQLEEMDLLN